MSVFRKCLSVGEYKRDNSLEIVFSYFSAVGILSNFSQREITQFGLPLREIFNGLFAL